MTIETLIVEVKAIPDANFPSAGLKSEIIAALRQQQDQGEPVAGWMVERDTDYESREYFHTEELARKNACMGVVDTHITPLVPQRQLGSVIAGFGDWCREHTAPFTSPPAPQEGMVSDKLVCEAVVATQFMDEHRRGRMACDVQELLAYLNEHKSK